MTREVTDNLYIDLGYFTPEDYYTYEALASADISSAFSVTCITTAGAVKDFDAAISVTAATTAEPLRILDFASTENVLFSIGVTAEITVNSFAVLDAVVTMSTDAQRNRATTVALDNLANLSAQADKLVETTAELDATSSLSADALNVQFATAQLTSSFTQTANNNSFYTFRTANNLEAFNQSGLGTVADPVISTGVKKYGAGSAYFAGPSGLYQTDLGWPSKSLRLQRNPFTLTETQTAWTIECWVRMATMQTTTSSNSSDNVPIITMGSWSTAPSDGAQTFNGVFAVYKSLNSSQAYIVYKNGATTSIAALPTFTAGTWYHLAIQYDTSNNLTVYGADSSGSGTRVLNANITDFTSTTNLVLGNDGTWGSTTFNGTSYSKTRRGINNPAMYVDDLRITYGRAVYSGTTYSTPTQALAVEGYNTRGKFAFDTDFNDYIGQVLFNASLTSTASVVCDAIAPKTYQGEAALTSTATQSADATRIKQFSSDLPAIATQLTAVAKIGDFLVACDNTATLTATAEVTRTVDSNLTSTATQTTLAVATLEGEVDLTSQFTQTAQATITRTVDSQLSTQATLEVTAVRNRFVDSQLTTQTQLTATAVKTVEAESEQQAQAQISVDTNVNKPFSADLPTLATQLTAAAKIGVTLVDCAVVSTLTADAISGKIVIANLNSNAELTNTVEVTRTLDAQLTVTAQQTAVNARLRASAVALSTQAQLTVDATSTKFADADLTAQFTVQAKPGGLQYAQANLSTQAQIQANATATKSAVAVLPTIGTQLAIGTETSTLSANLSATFTLVANVIEIRIDPDLTYIIPRETRTQMIADEWRDDIIIPESRSYEIVQELRDYAVANTEETYII